MFVCAGSHNITADIVAFNGTHMYVLLNRTCVCNTLTACVLWCARCLPHKPAGTGQQWKIMEYVESVANGYRQTIPQGSSHDFSATLRMAQEMPTSCTSHPCDPLLCELTLLPADWPAEVAGLIQDCWQQNPNDRPSFKSLELRIGQLRLHGAEEPAVPTRGVRQIFKGFRNA